MMIRGPSVAAEALNITYGVPATGLKYCMAKVGVIKFQPDLFAPGEYRFDVNGSKTSSGIRPARARAGSSEFRLESSRCERD